MTKTPYQLSLISMALVAFVAAGCADSHHHDRDDEHGRYTIPYDGYGDRPGAWRGDHGGWGHHDGGWPRDHDNDGHHDNDDRDRCGGSRGDGGPRNYGVSPDGPFRR
ncbi:MAG: hypothetical protein U0136_19880 [Bdellovibrionota bacterium]